MTTPEKQFQLTLLITRVIVGIVVLAHGAQKLLGWFGGYGFSGTMAFFTETIGLPYLLGLMIILAETLGMLGLIAGLFSRIMAWGVIAIMIGAIVTTHGQHGFFMNWSGALEGEGYEFHLLVIGLSWVTAFHGGGAFSLDHFLATKKWTSPEGSRVKS